MYDFKGLFIIFFGNIENSQLFAPMIKGHVFHQIFTSTKRFIIPDPL